MARIPSPVSGGVDQEVPLRPPLPCLKFASCRTIETSLHLGRRSLLNASLYLCGPAGARGRDLDWSDRARRLRFRDLSYILGHARTACLRREPPYRAVA